MGTNYHPFAVLGSDRFSEASMPEAVLVVGARPEFHRLGWPSLPKARLWAACRACSGLPGQGSQKPGGRQVSGVAGSQERALVLTRHLPNSKLLPTQMDILMLKAELEESGLLCPGCAPVRDTCGLNHG